MTNMSKNLSRSSGKQHIIIRKYTLAVHQRALYGSEFERPTLLLWVVDTVHIHSVVSDATGVVSRIQ
jgi:hypothetical protein